ncbi:hypothetical protein ACPB9J_33105 [Streptomyces lavendulocolor]|uniref:hypothetical protein n=1 Tax=Streptomyces lavendulocolor TaxID=67316 RepID=UPI003C2FF2C7
MSTETLTRFRCDAPHCPANGIGSDSITPPDGWTKLQSTAHIPVPQGPFNPYPARGRRKSLSYSERCYGGFSLHLCPDHPNAFDAHQPRTDGHGYKSNVSVSCSCGARIGSAPAATMVSRYPSHATEHAWFQHLPAELRWYLWRGERQWATRRVVNGFEIVDQHRSEEQARKMAEPSPYGYTTPQVVYRDTEGDPWTAAPADTAVTP